MNRRSGIVFLSGLILLQGGLTTVTSKGPQNPDSSSDYSRIPDSLLSQKDSFPPWLARDGRLLNQPPFDELYKPVLLDSLRLPVIDSQLIRALENQNRLLSTRQQKKRIRYDGLTITPEKLETTVEIMKSFAGLKLVNLDNFLSAHQISGADDKGNVKITAYYTPVIKVSSRPTEAHPYPIYARPDDWEGKLPSRAQIEDRDTLAGMGLELAYAADKISLYYMQVQGSGYIEFPDGERKLLSYDGSNLHPYRPIENFIRAHPSIDLTDLSIRGIRNFVRKNPRLKDTILYSNPSYTFFRISDGSPRGAGSVSLSPEISIAVDPDYIPLGSCLVLALPIFDTQHYRVVGHRLKFALAQDVGGAIRGPGRIDYYMGTGAEAERKAGLLNHYGRLWLLLPKSHSDDSSL